MADEKPKKKKIPTALKRIVQSKRRRLSNHAFKSKVRTAIRSYEKSLQEKKGKQDLEASLNSIYKLMDKGVKKGVFKLNKAARFKAKYSAKLK